jgi:hypothetical protein
MSRSRADLPGGDLIGPYLDDVAAKVERLAKEARGNVRPATLVAGYGRSNLAAQRDYFDTQNEKYASGDLGPREGFVGDVETADRNGRQLGHAALSALDALPPPQTKFVYTGPVVSGATLGTWRHDPLAKSEAAATAMFRCHDKTVDLAYRPDLPTIDETQRELKHWQAEEEKARAAGDATALRDAHARVERMNRRALRLATLPAGKTYPYKFAVARTGGLLWVVAPGELYQILQREIRRRFPGHAVVVATISDDWQPGYLPEAGTYGLGIYQEEIAVVAAGSLEKLIERVAGELETLVR